MPSKSPEQAKLMHAIASGWTPSRMKSPPSRAVAQEFVNADRKYSGGFAENRYWTGGLAPMDNVNSGGKRGSLEMLKWQEGGEVDYRVPGEPGVYEAPDVEGMGPALEQMFSDMEATRKGREREVIDYTWDKTQSREAETDLDERLEAMSGPEQVAYVKPRLLAAMAEMKTIGETPKFKQYSIKDYWLSTDQVSLWRGKWSNALQQQAREAKGPMPTEEELKRIGVDDAGNPIMMEEEGMQFGGGVGGIAAAYGRAQEMASQDPEESPYGTEASTTQQMLDRMGYSGPMGYLRLTSGLRQAGWTPASGSGDGDLANTMWYPPEGTLAGEDGEGAPPPRIIPTDPTSYVGGTALGTSDGGGGGGGGGSGEESPYREQLRQHKAKIAATLGSARGGHVNYYEEGGAVRPGHAEGPNPFEGKNKPAQYRLWERENHIDPPPPPKAAAEPEDIPWWKKIAGYGAGPTQTDEGLEAIGQAYGGRVGYQAGGLAIAAPAGGVPPWISPTGSGPGYMDEPPPGYQFGGIANRFNPPTAAPAPAMAQAQSAAGSAVAGMGGPRGGVMGGQYRGVPPQRGMISRGAQPGGLAAMLQQTRQQQTGAAGRLPPGIDPRAVAADREGWATHQADPRFAQQQEAQRRMDDLRTGGVMGGPAGGGTMGRVPMDMQPGPLNRTPSGEIDLGGGRTPEWGPDGPVRGRTPPFMPKVIPWNRPGPAPERVGGMGKPRPGPGMMPPGDEGGGIPGGPRVPPNMRGYLQRQRMMNRPPANVGGGANRVGMADQQGALSRAMQRGTGRPPMSRRAGFGRAGRRR